MTFRHTYYFNKHYDYFETIQRLWETFSIVRFDSGLI